MTVRPRTGSDVSRPRLGTVVNAATTGRLLFGESEDVLGVAKVAELTVAVDGIEEEVAIAGVVSTTTAGITCELSDIHVAVNMGSFWSQ